VKVRKDLEPYAKYKGRNVPGRIYRAYSVLVARHDSLVASITSFENEIKLLDGEKNDADRKTMKSEQNYLGKLSELRDRYNALISEGCPPDALESIDRALVAQGNVLERQEIPLRRVGNSFMVSVRINNAITADFMLDTGCSGMLLNTDLVKRLKLPQDQFLGLAQSSIADGSTMEVELLNLQSVQVGSFSVSNVYASVQTDQTQEDVSLLLGMSFLSHFHFSVDMSSSKLILERIRD
jgi:clan AA aspartic protease (TIGR02281 family)